MTHDVARWSGVTTALITPMLSDGSVDLDGLKWNVRAQIRSGVRGLLPLGTTGETPTLNPDETRAVITAVVGEADGIESASVMVGISSNSTKTTCENARQARDLGADALLVSSPYYNTPTPEGLIAHFATVSDCTDLPVVVYNVPGRTAVNITPETLAVIAEHPNVIAVKEASGDLGQIMAILRLSPDLVMLSGDDAMAFPVIALGGSGVVSTVSNLMPAPVVEMIDDALAGDMNRARQRHFDLLPMFDAAFIETNPGPIKHAMSVRQLPSGPLRLPLVCVRPDSAAQIEATLAGYADSQFPPPSAAAPSS